MTRILRYLLLTWNLRDHLRWRRAIMRDNVVSPRYLADLDAHIRYLSVAFIIARKELPLWLTRRSKITLRGQPGCSRIAEATSVPSPTPAPTR